MAAEDFLEIEEGILLVIFDDAEEKEKTGEEEDKRGKVARGHRR